MAATTLSVSLPQTFFLTMCLRDTKQIDARQLLTLNLSFADTFAALCVSAFAILGVVSYFVAIVSHELELNVTLFSTRRLYYAACMTYLVAVLFVGISLHDAEAADKVKSMIRGGLQRMSLRKGGSKMKVKPQGRKEEAGEMTTVVVKGGQSTVLDV